MMFFFLFGFFFKMFKVIQVSIYYVNSEQIESLYELTYSNHQILTNADCVIFLFLFFSN